MLFLPSVKEACGTSGWFKGWCSAGGFDLIGSVGNDHLKACFNNSLAIELSGRPPASMEGNHNNPVSGQHQDPSHWEATVEGKILIGEEGARSKN